MKSKNSNKKLYILLVLGIIVVAGLAIFSQGQLLKGDLGNIQKFGAAQKIPSVMKKTPLVSCSGDYVYNEKGYKVNDSQGLFDVSIIWRAQMSDGSTNVNYSWSGDMLNGKQGQQVEVSYPWEYQYAPQMAHVVATLANGEKREADCSHEEIEGLLYPIASLALGMTMDVSCKAEVFPLKPDSGKIIVWTAKVDKLIVPGYQGQPSLDFTQDVQGSNAQYEWHGHGLEGKNQATVNSTYASSDNTNVHGLVKITVPKLVAWGISQGPYYKVAECNFDLSQLNDPIILKNINLPVSAGVK